MRKRWWILVAATLTGVVSLAHADWSPPVLLWEDTTADWNLVAVDAAIAVDAQENVHIVFTHLFANPHYPHGPAFTQLSYTKFDPWGHQLVPEMMLSDSVALCSDPKIGLFGMDSLWVVWFNAGDFENEPYGIATRSLDLNGNPLRPATIWTDSMRESPVGYAFQVMPDRSVVLAFSDNDMRYIIGTILMIHQRADGTRILDHAPIYRESVEGEATRGVHGYADPMQDSLQISWEAAYYDMWDAVFGKRVSLQSPAVDTTHLGSHVELTPATPGHIRGPAGIQPVGDSLIAFAEHRQEGNCWLDSYLHILWRSDYSEVSAIEVGGSVDNMWVVEPGDSIISLFSYTCTSPPNIRFKRYRIPNLALLTDSLVYSNQAMDTLHEFMAYHVSASGSRQFVYQATSQALPRVAGLYYTCQPGNVSAVGPTPHNSEQVKSTYTISPNPASGQFTIAGPLGNATSIALYNILGQQVGREIHGLALQGQTLSYPTDDLPNGEYFLRITTPAGMTIQKVLLVH